MKKVLVITGPTASGKSNFAVGLAKELGGEIISGDSIQVYRGFDIGSGKIKEEEKQNIPHHLIDILSGHDRYNVMDFQQHARKEIDECCSLPILCGGTGFYIRACLYDYSFEQDISEISFEGKTDEELYEELKKVDPVQAEKIHPHNRRRIERSLTIYQSTGTPQSELEAKQKHEMIYDAYIVGCTMPREILYQRIDERVEEMFNDGLEKEVNHLLEEGYTFDDPGMQGIGYKEFKLYKEEGASLEEVKVEIQKHSRQFAKRQYTWFNHQLPVHWLNMLEEKDIQKEKEEIKNWLNQ